MAQDKFNLSKEEKGFDLSDSTKSKSSKFNLSKEQAPASTAADLEKNKRFKWLLLLLLAIVVTVVSILFFRNNFSNKLDSDVTAKVEQATAKATEISADVQSDNVNFDEAQANVEEAQKSVDQAKENAKTDAEKQVVADAQVKVDQAAKAVEVAKESTQTSGVDETPTPVKEEGITPTTIPDQVVRSEEPAAPDFQGSQSPTTKTDDSLTTTPSVTVSSGTLEQEAKYVIRGNYGNGADRKRALGSEYDAIQGKVNEMYRNGEVK